MNTPFTPSPWVKGRGNTVTKSNGFKIIQPLPSAAAPEAWDEISKEWAATAYLIEAAPDMYEALKAVRVTLMEVCEAWSTGDDCYSQELKIVDAAINKAEGK